MTRLASAGRVGENAGVAQAFDPRHAGEPDLRRIADAFVDARAADGVLRARLRHFAGRKRVLDIGCGGGAFLELLRGGGIEGFGLDASSAAVAACAARGLSAVGGDATTLLRRLCDERQQFDGAAIAHLVEHLLPAAVLELLIACARVLRPGSPVVVVTPNVRNLIVLEEVFWLDPTHVRPYPRALLEQLGRAAGLRVVASYDDPASIPRRSLPRRWVARLRSLLSGADRSAPMDAVVVLQRD